MKALHREVNTSPFVPDYMARSLLKVDFARLKKQGVRFIAFDADSTLVNFRGRIIDEKTKAYLMANKNMFEGWCIASNRITNDLLPLGESIGAPVVRATITNRKPQRRFFDQVIRHFGAKPSEIAMIGDKLLADIWGAKRVGMTTVWVEKLGHDSPWDWLFRTRWIERRILRRYVKE